ncbi:MAG: DUF86 domain-containing protein [Prevotellaceae bacterium]|jgi:uncharacterized protein with HEPN domain|nr:DUF86 domain-containing protein [Prevotellaceae bacterium]
MEERIGKWLYDIHSAIEEIDNYFVSEPKTFSNFCSKMMLKRAIERNLEIIGEATNRILSKSTEINISNARQIVNLRNFVIHSYDSVTNEHIWAIVINDLPKLKKEVDELLNEKP